MSEDQRCLVLFSFSFLPIFLRPWILVIFIWIHIFTSHPHNNHHSHTHKTITHHLQPMHPIHTIKLTRPTTPKYPTFNQTHSLILMPQSTHKYPNPLLQFPHHFQPFYQPQSSEEQPTRDIVRLSWEALFQQPLIMDPLPLVDSPDLLHPAYTDSFRESFLRRACSQVLLPSVVFEQYTLLFSSLPLARCSFGLKLSCYNQGLEKNYPHLMDSSHCLRLTELFYGDDLCSINFGMKISKTGENDEESCRMPPGLDFPIKSHQFLF